MYCRIATSPSFKDGDMLTRKLSTQFLHLCILKLEHFFFTLLCPTVETLLKCPWSENLSRTHTNYWYSRHDKLLQIQLLIQHTTSPFYFIVIVSLNLFNQLRRCLTARQGRDNAMPTRDYSDTHCFGNSFSDGWSVTSAAVELRMFD